MTGKNFNECKETERSNEPALNFSEKDAVNGIRDGMLEDAAYRLAQKEIASFEDMREVVYEYPADETAIINLTAEDEISLIQAYADDFGIALENIVPDNLRRIIEQTAALVAHMLAENEAMEAINKLKSFMERYGLGFENIVNGNNHGWARHRGERQEGEHCQVYEYRNLEHEQIHIDVWEYKAHGVELTFEVYLDPADVSDEENRWDST